MKVANLIERQRILTLLCFVLVQLCFTFHVSAQAKSAKEVAETTMPSVVLVVMQDEFGATESYGSGFSIGPGLIATNYHVIEGSESGSIIGVDGLTTSKIVGEVAVSPEHDLAIIAIEDREIRSLQLSKTSELSVGDTVFAVGNPRGQTGTFSSGIVSALRVNKSDGRIQTTTPVSPGSSGGPLVDSQGRVVGVIASQITQGQNLNFAIPVDRLHELIALKQEAKPLGSSFKNLSGGNTRSSNRRQDRRHLQKFEKGNYVFEAAAVDKQSQVSNGGTIFALSEHEVGTALLLVDDVKSTMPGSMRIGFGFSITRGELPFLYKDDGWAYYGVTPPRAKASFPGLGSVVDAKDTIGIRVRKKDGKREWYCDNSYHNNANTIWHRSLKSKEKKNVEGPKEVQLSESRSAQYEFYDVRDDVIVILERIETPKRDSERELRFPKDPFAKTIIHLSGLVIECMQFDQRKLTYKVLKHPTLDDLRR